MLNALGMAAVMAAAASSPAVWAEDAFDACDIFTQADAQKALGVPAAGEPANPKVKRPKVVTVCTYNGFKDSTPVAASAQFRFGKTEAEAQKAFDEARMQFQTKPMLISGVESFWSGKTGQMHIRKGRTWITVSLGPARLSDRDANEARKLAEILARKM
jgi:hypothetical protein